MASAFGSALDLTGCHVYLWVEDLLQMFLVPVIKKQVLEFLKVVAVALFQGLCLPVTVHILHTAYAQTPCQVILVVWCQIQCDHKHRAVFAMDVGYTRDHMGV